MGATEQNIFHHVGRKILTDDREIEVIARLEEPLIVVLDNVLSEEECDGLVEMARERLVRSKVGSVHEINAIRTSDGMFFEDRENSLVAKIEKRASDIMGIPIEYGDNLQVLKYQVGQEYRPHYDFFASPDVRNNRISTLIMYLNEVELGGETTFPNLKFAVSPKKGRAVYFEYFYTDQTMNERTLHAGAPILEGEKWVATQWMRRQKFRD